MIVCSFFYLKKLKNLEKNHKKFCDTNNFLHKIFYIEDNFLQKYSIILKELQENINETFIFIDSYTYFNNFNFNFTVSPILMMQKKGETYYDNFFIVKSTEQTIRLFKQLSKDYSYNIITKKDKKFFKLKLADHNFLEYPYKQHDLYMSVDLDGTNIFEKPQLSLTTFCNFGSAGISAEILCNHKNKKQSYCKNNFEIFNSNKKNAIVLMYTNEIKEYGTLSEKNYKKYCIKNNLTLYIYREQLKELSGFSGNWSKPFLLLKHINAHENIVWADSDTLITMDYQINFNKDVSLYDDISNWFFNSGFMVFKNTNLNINILQNIANEIISNGPTNNIYTNGGDQALFIKEILKAYPDVQPFSNLLGNTHPFFPFCDLSFSDKVYHFMGLGSPKVRFAIMQYYYNKIIKKI